MFYLQTIYHNNIGATYFFKDNLDPDLSMNKIQIIIGDIALILEDNEIFSFLKRFTELASNEFVIHQFLDRVLLKPHC